MTDVLLETRNVSRNFGALAATLIAFASVPHVLSPITEDTYTILNALPALSNSKGLPTNAAYGVTTMLLKVLRERQRGQGSGVASLAWVVESSAGSFAPSFAGGSTTITLVASSSCTRWCS